MHLCLRNYIYVWTIYMYMYTYVSVCVQFPFPPFLLFPPLNLSHNCRLPMNINKAWHIKLLYHLPLPLLLRVGRGKQVEGIGSQKAAKALGTARIPTVSSPTSTLRYTTVTYM